MADIQALERALINADKAGDAQAATMLAGEIQRLRIAPAKQPQQPTAQTGEPSVFDNAIDGGKVGVDQMWQKVKQAGSDGLQEGFFDHELDFGGGGQGASDDYGDYKAKLDTEIAASRNAPAMKTVGGVIGNAGAKILPAIAAGFLPGGQSLVGSAVIGSGVSAMEPNLGDESTLKKAALGGVFGAGGYGLGNLASKASAKSIQKALANPRIQQLNLLRKEGVVPTVGQTLGGIPGRLEEKAMSVPILGSVINGARNRAAGELEAAAYNRSLGHIGRKLPSGLTGRDALNFTEVASRQFYDDVLNKIGSVLPDEQFTANIAKVKTMVDDLAIPDSAKAKFYAAFDDVGQSLDKGAFTAESFKSLESTLGRDASTLGRAADVLDNRMAPAVKQLQAELKELLVRKAGGQADDLAKANRAWANFKRPQRAAASLGAEDGVISPAQLQSAIKALDRSKDKAAFARGNALMQDLGDAGAAILKPKIPNSGTADRLLPIAVGGAGVANPALTAGLIGGGSALYLRPITRGLNATLGPSANGSRVLRLLANPTVKKSYVPAGLLLGAELAK